MEDQKINVHLSGNEKELIIRHGQASAPVQCEPNKLQEFGTIETPSEYWQKRKGILDPNQCRVTFSRKGKCITLHCDEKDPYGPQLIGKLEYHPVIVNLGINDLERQYSQGDLLKSLRLLRPYFADPQDHVKLMKDLRNVQATLTTIVNNADDQKGNKKDFIERQLQTNMQFFFELDLPIYVGQPKTTFHIDLVAGYLASELVFTLESLDLVMKEEQALDDIFKTELDKFDDLVRIELV